MQKERNYEITLNISKKYRTQYFGKYQLDIQGDFVVSGKSGGGKTTLF